MPRFFCNNCLVELYLFQMDSSIVQSSAESARMPRSEKGFVTNCQHIFCIRCKQECAEKCPVCGHRGCQITEITSGMPKEIRVYFEPTHQITQKAANVIIFQQKQDKLYLNKSAQFNAYYVKERNKGRQQLHQIQEDIRQKIEKNKKSKIICRQIAEEKRKLQVAREREREYERQIELQRQSQHQLLQQLSHQQQNQNMFFFQQQGPNYRSQATPLAGKQHGPRESNNVWRHIETTDLENSTPFTFTRGSVDNDTGFGQNTTLFPFSKFSS